ncbi:hypothetical protein [Absidia glauca]|uniref:Uncharacterized protein n=1 Tax=Absidia glauca TaxID=4829 RepID=A0A163JY40_ABSGL|nr:hypothetical protein [Absidia glauca]
MVSLDNTESPKGVINIKGVVVMTTMRCHHIIDSAWPILFILQSCIIIQSNPFIHQQEILSYDYGYGYGYDYDYGVDDD